MVGSGTLPWALLDPHVGGDAVFYQGFVGLVDRRLIPVAGSLEHITNLQGSMASGRSHISVVLG